MSKKLRYLFRAMALGSLIFEKLPKYFADGQLTIDEMVDFVQQACAIGGWKTKISIPEDMVGELLGFELLDE